MADSDPINWLLLAELIAVVIVSSAFLFYWNRLVASVFAFFVRLVTWRYYNAYISIGSLQISPLAGRVSFRDIEYHSSNISFRALHGHLTFRYWWSRVRQEGDSQSDHSRRAKLPCRITCYAEGVEGFVFNRTPAYDAIVERMIKHEQSSKEKSAGSSSSSASTGVEANKTKSRLRKVFRAARGDRENELEPTSSNESNVYPPKSNELSKAPKSINQQQTNGVDWFREALPMEIRIVTGSLILGSDATPMVLIGDFKRADGVLEVTDSRSACDKYKMSIDLKFQDPKVLMRTNVDWSGPSLAHGKKVYDELLKREPDIAKKPPSSISIRSGFRLLARKFSFLSDPKFSSPPVAGLPNDRIWKGLARYRVDHEETPKNMKREEREYAKVTTLLESPGLDFSYYADNPGLVPDPAEADHIDATDELGNVELPPEYGIDIVVHGGIVKYGPWADRQRDAIQRAFAPSIFFDTEAKKRLRPGDTRIHTALILNLQLSEDTTLRIPTREPSKNWMYDNTTTEAERRYGWLDVATGANSSIVYTQAQFATKHGYDSILVLHLDSLEIASSVNLQSFIKAKACKLSLTMPTPLQWNAQRDWGLDLTLEEPDITLLRDHITLISDLAKDWSAGALGDFHHFVPNHYNFRINLLNYAFHLYINDYNIVDRPQSRDDNAIMDVTGPQLVGHVAVATTQYRPEFSVVPFTVDLNSARVVLCIPKWDTHRAFGEGDSFEVGQIGQVTARGSYRYYSSARPDHQENLTLHLEGRGVAFKALGWVLRRMFCIKDNYFGGFIQFTTMQEYLERFDHDPESVGDPVEEKHRPGRSDSFTVQVTMNVEESLIVLSDEIFSCRSGLAIPVPQLQMSLKSTEHFMELSLDATPTYVVASHDLQAIYDHASAPAIGGRDAIFVEGITLKANRLFGPQPRATTYLCLWEAIIPKLTGFMSPAFFSTLQASIQAVMYNFSDPDNAPAPIYVPKSPPDVTFFKLTIDSASIMLSTPEAAVVIDLPSGVNLDTSTLATRTCGSVLGLLIPILSMNLLSRRTEHRKLLSTGSVRTGVSLDLYKAPRGWREKASRQQKFIQEQDALTQRIWYMYRDGDETVNGHHVYSEYLPRPRVIGYDDSDDDSAPGREGREELEKLESSDMSSDTDTPQVVGSVINVAKHGRADHSRAPRVWKQRSRSFATAKDTTRVESPNDESDTSSNTSSGSSTVSSNSDALANDMASVLGAMFHRLRSFQKLPPAIWRNDEEMDEGDDAEPICGPQFEEGVLLRVITHPLDIELSLESVHCATSIGRALQEMEIPPERLLDALLIGQTDAVLEDKAGKVPFILDGTVPTIFVRATTSSYGTPVSIIDAIVSRMSVNMHKCPEEEASTSRINLSSSLRHFQVTVSSLIYGGTDISLLDVDQPFSLPTNGVPLLRISGDRQRMGYSVESGHQQIRAAGGVDISTVTPAFNLVVDTAQAWRDVVVNLPTTGQQQTHTSSLLHMILKRTSSPEVAAGMPAFASESAYGLHVEDQRNIRRDLGWWLISRLRHWLRTNVAEGAGEGLGSAPSKDTPESFVVKLAFLDDLSGATEALVRQQHFIQLAFGPELAVPSVDKNAKAPSFGAFLTFDFVSLRHYGRLVGSDTVSGSVMRIEKASVGIHHNSVVREEMRIQQVRSLVAVNKLEVEIQNSFLSAAQHILAAIQAAPQQPVRQESDEAKASFLLVLNAHLNQGDVSIVAGDMRLRTRISKAQNCFAHRRIPQAENARTHVSVKNSVTATADLIEVILLALVDGQAGATPVERIVLSTKTERLRVASDTHRSTSRTVERKVRLSVGLRTVELESRPQLKAFLMFAQDWKNRHYSHYRPLVEEFSALFSRRQTTMPEGTKVPVKMVIDVLVGSAQVQLRAAKALRLRWEIGKIFLSRQGTSNGLRFGVRIAPQVVGVYSSLRPPKASDSAALRLPSITVIGSTGMNGGRSLTTARIDLGFFTGILKPVVLDRLLSLHQQLRADLMDIFRDYQSGIKKALQLGHSKSVSTTSTEAEVMETIRQGNSAFNIHVGVAGIRFGLRADDVATTLLFEALSLKGHATNQSTKDGAVLWRAKVDHFGLSLGHLGVDALSVDAEPRRRYRSAYMLLDIEIHEIPGAARAASNLSVSLNRVHTVMHVAALNELSDLINSWSYDIGILHDNRAAEMAEVKHETTRILKKIESAERGSQPEASWFATRLLTVEVTGLGIAIPLSQETSIGSDGKGGQPVPALLFSVRVISFQNRRNETARFRVQQMALQFLHKFDQGVSEHFTGDFHPARNRMSLPSIDAEAQMSSKPDIWQLSAHCSATDFKLSLAPDVADGIFQLIDLYTHGRDHITHLEKHYRSEISKRDASESVAARYGDHEKSVPTSRQSQRIMIHMSFSFNSGLVEMHRSAVEADVRTVASDLRGRPSRVSRHDTFTLPSISVWLDYAEEVPEGQDEDEKAGSVVLNAAVHESRNVLRPSILPFFVEIASRIEKHIKEKLPTSPAAKAGAVVPDGPRPALPSLPPSESALYTIAGPSTTKLRVRFTLRIDRSELRLSCAPDSNAYVDLKWKSGGFLATATLGGLSSTSVAGSISGVTAYLSHEFAEQDRSCIEAGSKDMVFSIMYNPSWRENQRGLSIVVDTQISTHFRLEAFSAWLIFTSVWIDNAPSIDLPLRAGVAEVPPTPVPAHPHERKLGISILARIRTIDFDADIAVSRAKLEITPIVLRSLADGEQTKVDLRFGVTQASARGDISGDIRSESLVFSTARRSSRASTTTDPTVLALSIQGGDLGGNLFLGDVNILRFHLDPSDVSLIDDWKAFTEDPSAQVFLSFGVRAGQFEGVVRLLAIPRLLGNFYSVFDMVDSQQKIASQRSEAFKTRRLRRATDPSPVAAALLQTVHLAEAHFSGAAQVKTAQTMRFDLSGVDIGIYNEVFDQGQISDFYRFVVGKVEADLKRQSTKEDLPKRDLSLLVTYVRWDTSDAHKAAAEEVREMTAREMIDRAARLGRREVASLPSMTLTMASVEYPGPPTLEYDFDLIWGETDGDVAILPNFFEQAFRAFQKLVHGLDEQKVARARRLGAPAPPSKSKKKHDKDTEEEESQSKEKVLRYRRRDAGAAGAMPIPRLKLLGEGTTDAAKLVPKIKSAVNELPSISHRFVTLPLEEGMDVLLKLYEKQLPDRTT